MKIIEKQGERATEMLSSDGLSQLSCHNKTRRWWLTQRTRVSQSRRPKVQAQVPANLVSEEGPLPGVCPWKENPWVTLHVRTPVPPGQDHTAMTSFNLNYPRRPFSKHCHMGVRASEGEPSGAQTSPQHISHLKIVIKGLQAPV